MTQTRQLRRFSHLRLVTRDGVRLEAPLNAVEAPESPLAVSFHGITREEQKKALAAFPGGKRFRLVGGV